MLPQRLASAIIVLVSLVWLANFLLQFIIPGYHPDSYIHGIFTTVIGGAFALSRRDRSEESHPPEASAPVSAAPKDE